MKKFLTLIFAFLFLQIIVQCDRAETNIYKGNWVGTYTGTQFQGDINFIVNSDGKISGNTISNKSSQAISGLVNADGKISFNHSFPADYLAIGISFTGQLKENSGNGDWFMTTTQEKGTWTIHKN